MSNLFWHKNFIDITKRNELMGHNSACLWFTGLSGSGKSTLANLVETKLFDRNVHTYVLDGDNIRHGLNKGLGFDKDHRKENIRRIGEVAKLFVDAGLIVLTAFISPFRSDRLIARELLSVNQFIEIYVKCDLSVCEKRDPKGLYEKARQEKIENFTGISSPYEEPENPELTIFNGEESDLEANVNIIINFLENRRIIKPMADINV